MSCTVAARALIEGNDRWQPRGVVLPNAPKAMLQVAVAGDIDGDGGQDVLTNLSSAGAVGLADGTMHLIPSTPRSPD